MKRTAALSALPASRSPDEQIFVSLSFVLFSVSNWACKLFFLSIETMAIQMAMSGQHGERDEREELTGQSE